MDKSRLKEIIHEELKNVLIENTGYTVVYRDRALDKTYTAEIPSGISKSEIKQMLKKVVPVGLEIIGIEPLKESVNEGAISPRDAKKLSIGDIVKTQKNTYKITGYGNKSNAFRQFEVEDVKGKKYNIQVSLRGNSDILVAPGRSLRFTEPGEMLELKESALVISTEGHVSEASGVWKVFDAKMKLHGQAMDIEDQMRDISAELQTAYGDMEQEAEPGGGPIADRYGKEIEALQTNHKNLKAKLDQVFAKLDKLEQY